MQKRFHIARWRRGMRLRRLARAVMKEVSDCSLHVVKSRAGC